MCCATELFLVLISETKSIMLRFGNKESKTREESRGSGGLEEAWVEGCMNVLNLS